MNRAIAFVVLIILSISCSQKSNKTSLPTADEGIYNVEIIQKNYESKSFELWAKELTSKDDTTLGEDIKVIFFDPSGDTSSVLYAEKGWYVEKSGNVGAIGNVRVYATRGDTLLTEELLYIDSFREIRAPGHVVIFRKGQKIEGNGLKSDVGFKRVIIGGKVIGRDS